MLASLMLAAINAIIFFVTDIIPWLASVGILNIACIIIYFVNSCKIAPNKRAFLHLYFLLDNLILINLAA